MKYFEEVLNKQRSLIKVSEISFFDFLRSLEKQVSKEGWGSVNQHYRLQTFHLSDDLIHYDKIYKLEDFDSALIDISSKLNTKIPKVQQKGHKTDAEEKLAIFFEDKNTIDIVKNLFKSDLDRFKYDVPL